MTRYLRAFCEREKSDEEAGPIRFVASTEGMKRDRKDLKAEDWNLDNYRRNPVVLWVHDYMGRNLPLGRAEVQVDGTRLVADVLFDTEDEFARQVESKYRRGFLNAVSVGWEDVDKGQHELLDISAVPVPADPDALMERERRALADLHSDLSFILGRQQTDRRGAIPPHSAEKAPEDAGWDGPGEVAAAEGREQLRRMHAWVEDRADPGLKRAYKLPHHQAESGQVVWRGVAAAMARLLQAGTQIPDDDRRGVYNHLRRHYEQFDKEPPEFRTNEQLAALGLAELRGLFLEGEPELFPELFTVRAGAVLSGRNRQDLEQARDLIQKVLERAMPAQEEDEDDERAEDEALARLHRVLQAIKIPGG